MEQRADLETTARAINMLLAQGYTMADACRLLTLPYGATVQRFRRAGWTRRSVMVCASEEQG